MEMEVDNIVLEYPRALLSGWANKIALSLAILGKGQGQVDALCWLTCTTFLVIYLLPVLILSIILF